MSASPSQGSEAPPQSECAIVRRSERRARVRASRPAKLAPGKRPHATGAAGAVAIDPRSATAPAAPAAEGEDAAGALPGVTEEGASCCGATARVSAIGERGLSAQATDTSARSGAASPRRGAGWFSARWSASRLARDTCERTAALWECSARAACVSRDRRFVLRIGGRMIAATGCVPGGCTCATGQPSGAPPPARRGGFVILAGHGCWVRAHR